MNNEATNKNRYPIYHDGNVLKSDDLNGSFNFLHKQLKDTRSLLFGQGILNGLACKYDSEKGEITISPGTALTASGSVLENAEEMVIRYYVDKADCPMQGLPAEALFVLKVEATNSKWQEVLANKGKLLESLENKEEYLLGLQVVEYEVYKDNKDRICSEQSCSMHGDEVQMELVPFLMKPSGKDNGSKKSAFEPIPELELPSASGLADYPILPIFLRNSADYFYKKMAAIKTGLSAIGQIDFEHLLSDAQWRWYSQLFGKEAGLQASMDKLNSIRFDNRRINTYFCFANDVLDAVNEFIASYNDFQARYQLVLENRLDEAIILGKLDIAGDTAEDSKRYTWTETYRDYNRSKEERVLVRLLKRIALLIDLFVPVEQPMADADICFVPSCLNGKLGERSIPHYYQGNEVLAEYWDAHNDYHIDTQKNLSSSKADFDKADLYRLSFDNLGASKLDDLRAQANNNNLPVVILKYELDGDDVSYCLEDYADESLRSGEQFSGQTISDLVLEDKKLINTVADKNKVINVFNKLWEYYPKYNVIEAEKSIATLRETLIEEIRQSIYLLTKENELKPNEKNALEFIMMAILCHRVKKEGLFNPVNLPGVDFVGGVEKRDAMLLVTHRDKALTCLNMPYLSLVLNEALFKDQLVNYKNEKESNLQSIFKPLIVEGGSDLVEPQKEGYDLFMLNYGRNKEHTANYLRERGKITFRRAMDMVNRLPVFIFNIKTWDEAFRICFVLNERLKSNVLIVPVEMAKRDANGQLKGFNTEKFDLKVTLFEEELVKDAVSKLKRLLPGIKNSIEASTDPSEPRAVWMRDLTSKKVSVDSLTKLKMDAVFEFFPISK